MLTTSGWILLLWVVCVHGVARPPMITKEPGFIVYFKPGETVMLRCEGNGEPWPIFSWKLNTQDYYPSGNDDRVVQLQNSGTLVNRSPGERDQGMYECSATNDYGTAVAKYFDLRAAKMDMFPSSPATIHSVSLGMPLTLGCVPPTSLPPAQVFWIVKDELDDIEAVSYSARVTMDKEYGLNFANILLEDEQGGRSYSCMAVNTILRRNAMGPQHFIKVDEQAPGFQEVKYMWSDLTERFGLRGRRLSTKCIFSGFPTPDVHWERTDNKSFSNRVQFTMFSTEMTIENVQFEDAGSYECWAENIASGGRRVTRVFNVRVDASPQFLQTPESVETAVGATVQFHCDADGAPPPAIRWYINGHRAVDDLRTHSGRYSIGRNTFQIENVEQSDMMVIQCYSTNKHGNVWTNAYLSVLAGRAEAPEIISPPVSYLVSAEGLSVNLTCRTTGYPNPTITWFKDGAQVIDDRKQILTNGDLYIDHLELTDAAHYMCEAKNIFNTTRAEGVLVVRKRTRIEQKPDDLEMNAGKNATFACSGTTDPEEEHNLQILWLKDGELITSNDQRMMINSQNNSLTISETLTRDSGTYTCVATNGLDSANASAVLTVKDAAHDHASTIGCVIGTVLGIVLVIALTISLIICYKRRFQADQTTKHKVESAHSHEHKTDWV